MADKVSSLLLYVPELMLHVSRPVRWDSDHVTIMDDPTQNIIRKHNDNPERSIQAFRRQLRQQSRRTGHKNRTDQNHQDNGETSEIHISVRNLVKIYDWPGRISRQWHSGLQIRKRLGIESKLPCVSGICRS